MLTGSRALSSQIKSWGPDHRNYQRLRLASTLNSPDVRVFSVGGFPSVCVFISVYDYPTGELLKCNM